MLPSRTTRASLLACALCAAACGPCGGRERGRGEGEGAARRYTVRGEVVRLPAPDWAVRELALRHEAIDGFRDASGRVVGMDAMVMPFVVAPEVSLDGVRLGDAVEVVIAVGWAPPSMRIERLRRLPAGTTLTFERARPGRAPAP